MSDSVLGAWVIVSLLVFPLRLNAPWSTAPPSCPEWRAESGIGHDITGRKLENPVTGDLSGTTRSASRRDHVDERTHPLPAGAPMRRPVWTREGDPDGFRSSCRRP